MMNLMTMTNKLVKIIALTLQQQINVGRKQPIRVRYIEKVVLIEQWMNLSIEKLAELSVSALEELFVNPPYTVSIHPMLPPSRLTWRTYHRSVPIGTLFLYSDGTPTRQYMIGDARRSRCGDRPQSSRGSGCRNHRLNRRRCCRRHTPHHTDNRNRDTTSHCRQTIHRRRGVLFNCSFFLNTQVLLNTFGH